VKSKTIQDQSVLGYRLFRGQKKRSGLADDRSGLRSAESLLTASLEYQGIPRIAVELGVSLNALYSHGRALKQELLELDFGGGLASSLGHLPTS
jgi:hypothetical protein